MKNELEIFKNNLKLLGLTEKEFIDLEYDYIQLQLHLGKKLTPYLIKELSLIQELRRNNE